MYEFTCNDCQRDFESYSPTTDYGDLCCPHCGSNDIDKLFSSEVHYRFYKLKESTINKVSKDQANKSNPFSEAFSLKPQRRNDIGNKKAT